MARSLGQIATSDGINNLPDNALWNEVEDVDQG